MNKIIKARALELGRDFREACYIVIGGSRKMMRIDRMIDELGFDFDLKIEVILTPRKFDVPKVDSRGRVRLSHADKKALQKLNIKVRL